MTIQTSLYDRIRLLSALHAESSRNTETEQLIQVIKYFEQTRLRKTYADFLANPQYQSSVEFMINDLFGTDQRARDREMERAYPAMIRLLPEHILRTVASAVEFNILTVSFETALAGVLPRAKQSIDTQEYCTAFMTGNCLQYRQAQVMLMQTVGTDLDSIVRKPFIATTLKLCRTPAKMAGLGVLQNFLERGFSAFQSMRNPDKFLSVFSERESRINQRIAAGTVHPFDAI